MRNLNVIFLLAAASHAAASVLLADLQQGPAKLSLLVYNFAQVDSATLEWAENEASRILSGAGVPSEWHHCTVSPAPPDPGCEAAFGLTAVTLKILPREMVERLPHHANDLGFVAQPSDGGFAIHAMIFFHRVEDLANRRACPSKVLLAYAMAHEIGHALLGTGSHGRQGIMKAYWGPREMMHASQGRLKFTRRQAGRLRSQLERRRTAQMAGR